MLITLRELLDKTSSSRMAFNISSVEGFHAMVDICEERKFPMIVQIAERYLRDLGEDFIRNVVVPKLKGSSATFVLHLDHGGSLSVVLRAFQLGFTSVMFDGSMLPLQENINATQHIAELAHTLGISAEGEIGHVGGAENEGEESEAHLSSVEDAKIFADKTEVDALAVAVGNAHGIYRKEPRLDIQRIKRISEAATVPLVLHGGTGIPISQLEAASHAGIKKINIGTDLKLAWIEGAKLGIQKYSELDDIRRTIRQSITETILKFKGILEGD